MHVCIYRTSSLSALSNFRSPNLSTAVLKTSMEKKPLSLTLPESSAMNFKASVVSVYSRMMMDDDDDDDGSMTHQ